HLDIGRAAVGQGASEVQIPMTSWKATRLCIDGVIIAVRPSMVADVPAFPSTAFETTPLNPIPDTSITPYFNPDTPFKPGKPAEKKPSKPAAGSTDDLFKPL
ncbi:MAG: hypothetical protein ACK5Q5_07635, partial [Planctomycetaceae bacterium]